MDPYGLLEKVREEKPLVHHITNWVTISDCAYIVKVLGGSPVMAHAKEEVADMVALASALVLNIGTLTPELVESMILAAKAANNKGIPVILDVCGAGATPLRDRSCAEILDRASVNIIKGNASEIARIAGESVTTRGVDSTEVTKDLSVIAQTLARNRKATVVITGKEDIIASADRLCRVANGVSMMARIVGTGCMATSVIGTFAAVEKDLVTAATAGLCCYEIAAEIAFTTCQGPGHFRERLFDIAYMLTRESVDSRKKIT